VENQFREKDSKSEASTNGYIFKMAVGIKPAKGVVARCGHTMLGTVVVAAASPMAPSHCILHLLAGASLYK